MIASIQHCTGCHSQCNEERDRKKKGLKELKTVIHKRYDCAYKNLQINPKTIRINK